MVVNPVVYVDMRDISADLDKVKCCIVNRGWQSVHNRFSGKFDCAFDAKTVLMNYKYRIIKKFIPPGTVTITNVTADADIDLSTIVLFGIMSGTVEVTIGTLIIIISVFSGTYADLDELIDGIIAGMIGGWTGTNNDPILTVIAPSNLGVNPVGATVTVQLAPYYYNKNAPGQSGNTTHTAIGYTTIIIGRPAYVAASDSGYVNDLLYVPTGDSYPNFGTTQNFNGFTNGSAQVANIGTGRSTVVFAAGRTYFFQVTVTGDLYVLNFAITGYNPGTGVLSFNVTTITKNGLGNTPIDALGSQSWLLNLGAPGWGTVNVYNINPTTGVLTLNTFIEVHASSITEAIYDINSNAVFLCCGGGGRSAAAKIDMVSPFAVADVVDINAGGGLYGLNMMQSSNGNFYINSGNTIMSKFDTNTPMGFNAAANIASVAPTYYGSAASITFNSSTNEMYYAPYSPFNVDKVYKALCNPDINTPDAPVTDLIQFLDYGTTANPYATGNLTGVNEEGLIFHLATNALYVVRNTSTGQAVFQRYDLGAGNNAAINASKQSYFLLPGYPVKATYQPGADKIFITNTTGGNTLFIFDPNTQTFDISAVNVPNGLKVFSFTDDGVNNNFFGDSGGGLNWLAVISIENDILELSGEFDGEVTEHVRTASENCQTEQQILNGLEQLLGECKVCCGGTVSDLPNNNTPPVIIETVYYGRSTLTGLNEAQILALGSANQSTFNGTYNFIDAETYLYFAYPASFGTPSQFHDNIGGFDVVMDTPYNITVNGVIYTTYRSAFMLGGIQSMTVT